jgi:hypothetical protein
MVGKIIERGLVLDIAAGDGAGQMADALKQG